MSKTALFKIENIDLNNGNVTVRFINKYGPIYTNEKTIEDFMIEVEVPGDTFTQEGVNIPKKEKVLITNNPNDDLVYSVDIPLDQDNKYVPEEQLLQTISMLYPTDQFELYLKKKTAIKNELLENMVGVEYEITINQIPYEPLGIENYNEENHTVHII